jgi:hypothetical protein
MHDTGAPAKAMIKGIVQNIRSDRCKNGSYYRKFSVNYSDSYRDQSGELVFVNMRQWIVGFNEVARKIKAEVSEGCEVYLVGRLKSRELVNFVEEIFIEIEEPEDITVLPSMGEI